MAVVSSHGTVCPTPGHRPDTSHPAVRDVHRIINSTYGARSDAGPRLCGDRDALYTAADSPEAVRNRASSDADRAAGRAHQAHTLTPVWERD